MTTGKAMPQSATNPGILERVFQCYVIAGLFSTSGIDVLLVMTLVLLVFASVWRTVLLFSRDDLAFLECQTPPYTHPRRRGGGPPSCNSPQVVVPQRLRSWSGTLPRVVPRPFSRH